MNPATLPGMELRKDPRYVTRMDYVIDGFFTLLALPILPIIIGFYWFGRVSTHIRLGSRP